MDLLNYIDIYNNMENMPYLVMIVIMIMRMLRIVTMNRILWIHFGYLSFSRNGGFGFLDWQKLSLQILSAELGWKIQRVCVTLVRTALQRGGQRPSQALGPGGVQVGLDVLVHHHRHRLAARLALLASLPRPNLEQEENFKNF